MTTSDESATFYWPSFTDMAERPRVRLHIGTDGRYAVIYFAESSTDLNVHIHTTAQCDALIKAAVTAKDLLLGAQEPPPLSRDLSGDLDAIPANQIGEPA